ncbi:MAG: HYR domain-containing protein [Polyangiales bacterium]
MTDAIGPISSLRVSFNGQPAEEIFPDDRVLDSGDERFSIPLDSFPKGQHLVSVSATDASGNQNSAEITVKR